MWWLRSPGNNTNNAANVNNNGYVNNNGNNVNNNNNGVRADLRWPWPVTAFMETESVPIFQRNRIPFRRRKNKDCQMEETKDFLHGSFMSGIHTDCIRA